MRYALTVDPWDARRRHVNPRRFTNAPHRSQDRSGLCSTHQSLSRNTVHRYQETPFNFTQASAALLHHKCSRAALWGTSRHADRLGTAAMGRNTCANQRPHLLLR